MKVPINFDRVQFLHLIEGPPVERMRLVELHERSRTCQEEERHFYEREIALRIVKEAQRERRQWAMERFGNQPVPCA